MVQVAAALPEIAAECRRGLPQVDRAHLALGRAQRDTAGGHGVFEQPGSRRDCLAVELGQRVAEVAYLAMLHDRLSHGRLQGWRQQYSRRYYSSAAPRRRAG